MKITKRQLRRIIKEEMARSEADDYMSAKVAAVNYLDQPSIEAKTAKEWVDHLGQIIDQDMTSRGLTSYKEEGAAVIAALEILRREIKNEIRGDTR